MLVSGAQQKAIQLYMYIFFRFFFIIGFLQDNLIYLVRYRKSLLFILYIVVCHCPFKSFSALVLDEGVPDCQPLQAFDPILFVPLLNLHSEDGSPGGTRMTPSGENEFILQLSQSLKNYKPPVEPSHSASLHQFRGGFLLHVTADLPGRSPAGTAHLETPTGGFGLC